MHVLWWIHGEPTQRPAWAAHACIHVAPPHSASAGGPQTVPREHLWIPCSQPGGEDNVPGPRHAAPETRRLVSDFMENVSQSCPWPSPLPPGAPPDPLAPFPLLPPPLPPMLCASPHSSPNTSSSHILSAHLSCSFTSQLTLGLIPLPSVLSQDRRTAILRHRVGAERQLDPGLRQDGCPSWTRGVEDEVPRLPQPHP